MGFKSHHALVWNQNFKDGKTYEANYYQVGDFVPYLCGICAQNISFS
jgi:hypothetical protein